MLSKTTVGCVAAAALGWIAAAGQAKAAGPYGATFELSSLDGTNGFVLNGIEALDASGQSVANAGDINNDGIDDLLIGASFAEVNGLGGVGECYVVFGATGLGAGGVFELSTLNGTNGFILQGIDAFDLSGNSVSGTGDVNGDGVDDLIIGAEQADPNGDRSGEVYVVFGGAGVGAGGLIDLSTLNGANGFVCNGLNAMNFCGSSVSCAGDVNDDGVNDLIIGARGASKSYIIFGGVGIGAGGVIDLSALNGTNGIVCNGVAGTESGISVSGSGDVNGDEIDDIVIGSSSRSHVVFGGAGIGAGGVIDLSALNGTDGFACIGSSRSVSGAGDVNGDGIDDLIIGDYLADPNGNNSGQSHVVFGSAGIGAGGSLDLSTLDGISGVSFYGIADGDESGKAVSGAGDINGDGFDDILIAAAEADPNGSQSGEFYLLFGSDECYWVLLRGDLEFASLNGPGADGEFGAVFNGIDADDQLNTAAISGAGDVNNDGLDDFIIGARRADPNGSTSGECYVIFGKASPAPIEGDLNGDGIVDTADLGILISNFGMMSP